MPAHHDKSVELACRDQLGNLGRVAPREAINSRISSPIDKETVAIAGGQVDVPVKRNSEAGSGLLVRSHTVREKHLQVAASSELAEQRRLVLDRVAGENAKVHQLGPARKVSLWLSSRDSRTSASTRPTYNQATKPGSVLKVMKPCWMNGAAKPASGSA